MAQDLTLYLNRDPALMQGSLVRALEELPAKLQKAPASQWLATIKGLLGKGAAKQAEVDDCELLQWLDNPTVDAKRAMTREELISYVKNRLTTVKEVTLGTPQYQTWSHAMHVPGSRYEEVLFIANSERANIDDRLEEVDWQLEQYNFDLEKLSSDPQGVLRLEAERQELLGNQKKAWDYAAPHFTQSAGKYAKNLIAHGRTLRFGDTFMIEEVQSDWGQRGRKADWKDIPKGPFVTDTKLWAGLVVRRLLQRAATDPSVRTVAWIRGSMRNGGLQVTEDKLDEFYLKVVRGIVDKAISKAGGKTMLRNIQIGATTVPDVPCFEMTDEVRKQLQAVQPLYSLVGLRRDSHKFDDARCQAFFARAQHMLGSVKHVRLVDQVYDVASGRRVAGRFTPRLVQVALNADNPEFVLDHECFHYAMEHLLADHEREVIRRDFAPGSQLNNRTYETLVGMGERDASAQCLASAEEAAAHAFGLWARGKLDVNEREVGGIFRDLRILVSDCVAWLKRTVMGHRCTSSEEVFKALLNGERAEPQTRPARQREAA